ncbi:MAG: hypothetical protein ACM3ZQ_08615 [Bacillota bacterium]
MDIRHMAPGGRVSTGLLAWHDQRLVFTISQPSYWLVEQGRTRIDLIGIGGGQEAGETLTEAVCREAVEEAGEEIAIVGAKRTLISWQDGRLEQMDAPAGETAPLLIWQRMIPIKKPGREPYDCTWATAVYEGVFHNRPHPASESPALVWIGLQDFLTLAEHPRPLAELLGNGTFYEGVELPDGTLVGLSGSALYLAEFFDRLERGE